jgi:hypothetical protein
MLVSRIQAVLIRQEVEGSRPRAGGLRGPGLGPRRRRGEGAGHRATAAGSSPSGVNPTAVTSSDGTTCCNFTDYASYTRALRAR